MSSKPFVSNKIYIKNKEGSECLTTIMDLTHRKIKGCSLSDGMSTDDPRDSEQTN
jgi:hypothetical protein